MLEDYKETDSDKEKQEIIHNFFKMLWDSKCHFTKYKKDYSFNVDEKSLNYKEDLIELFKKYNKIELQYCKSFYKKKLDYIDYIRIHVNNMYGYLTDKDIYLPKEYYQLVLTPRKEYYKAIKKLRNNENVDLNVIKNKIINNYDKAIKLKEESDKKKVNMKWKEFKKLTEGYIERIFNNYKTPYEYEQENGWELMINIDGWSEDNYVVKYFCRSLTGYFRTYIKKLNKTKELKKCLICNIVIKNTSNNKKYCTKCSKDVHKKQKKNWKRKRSDFVRNKKKIGEKQINNSGTIMTLINYKSYNNIDIELDNGYIIEGVSYGNFKKGMIRTPYDKRCYGVGYLGVGEYRPTKNGKHTPQYNRWRSMMSRCYSDKYHNRQPTYKSCEVCEEWHNFQNFAKWYDDNFYKVENETMCLDKDIINKNNKIYNSENCIFVPKSINNLFVKSNKVRGDLPIGVSYNEKEKRYYARCNINSKEKVYIGIYKTANEAFYAYKNFKENYIKEIAEKYKKKIPNKLYKALMTYEVEITD